MVFGIDNGQDLTAQHVKDCEDQNPQYNGTCVVEALDMESSEMEARRKVSSSV